MTLSDQALRLNFASGRRDLPPLILTTDVIRLPDPMAAAAKLPPFSAVLLRHPDPQARRELAMSLMALCRDHHLRLIVSDDFALAQDLGADGLHLPEHAAWRPEAITLRRRWRGPLLTMAAHSPASLRRARLIGVDAALVSPVLPTQSHPGRPAIGVQRLLIWGRDSRVPIYALGGITSRDAGRLHSPAIVGIAGISGLV